MTDCSSKINTEIHEFFTQFLRSNSTLDNIALKEKLIDQLTNCVDQMSKLKNEFHVDFNKFNEQCFSEMMDNFTKMIDEKMVKLRFMIKLIKLKLFLLVIMIYDNFFLFK